MIWDLDKWQTPLFSHLVNRIGLGLTGIEVTNSNGRYAGSSSILSVVEAFAGVVDNQRISWALENFVEFICGTAPALNFSQFFAHALILHAPSNVPHNWLAMERSGIASQLCGTLGMPDSVF